jgi:hypothetical protein
MAEPTIDDVLAQLDVIIGVAGRRGSADGYFAALYRRVTAAVKARAAAGAFQDGGRMEQFDVIFASRYTAAWTARERGQSTSAVWNVALGCDRAYWPVVLQHLLVGMNAHINLDLGIAAAECAPGESIHELEADFNAINDVLCAMIDDVQLRLTKVWPALRVIDRVCGDFDEAVVNFSIRRARDQAWQLALTLAALATERERRQKIEEVDLAMSLIGRRVLRPGVALALKLAWVRLRERGSVAEKIRVMLD